MKQTGTRIFYSAVCIIILCCALYSCAGKLEQPAQTDFSGKTDPPLQDKNPAKETRFPQEAVLTASSLIASNIEKTFPVFDPEGKNASDRAVPLTLTDTALSLLPYAAFTSLTPKPDSLTVKIIETQEINSFSAGNAYIFITRNLLETAENKQQQAALIAHELAHISLGHTLRGFNPVSEKTIKMSSEQCLYALMQGYSEEDEFDADAETVRILALAGFHPNTFPNLLQNIALHLIPGTPDMATTHPSIQQRITRIGKKAQ